MRILFIISFILISPMLLAQQKKPLDFKINASYGIANFHLQNFSNKYRPVGSYRIGLALENDTKISLSPSFGFMKYGGQTNYNDWNFRVQYIFFNLQLKYKVHPKFTLYLGPYIATVVNKNIESSNVNLLGYFNDLYKQADYGLGLAQSYNISKRISIVMNQTYGLQNLNIANNGFYPLQGDWVRNYSIHLGVSYRL